MRTIDSMAVGCIAMMFWLAFGVSVGSFIFFRPEIGWLVLSALAGVFGYGLWVSDGRGIFAGCLVGLLVAVLSWSLGHWWIFPSVGFLGGSMGGLLRRMSRR